MVWLSSFVLILAAIGHATFWVGVVSRVHGRHIPRWKIHLVDKTCGVLLLGLPLAGACWLYEAGWDFFLAALKQPALFGWPGVYLLLAAAYGLWFLPVWTFWRLIGSGGKALAVNHTTIYNVPQELGRSLAGNFRTRFLASLPGNEVHQLAVHEKRLRVPNWPAALDGLSLVHLSDLHFTGGTVREYFDFVVDRANDPKADLALITGDIVDYAACLDWIPQVLGRLRARHGVFAILGNHDRRKINPQHVREKLAECGIVDLGGGFELCEVRGQSLLLAGNERPWFPDLPELAHAPPAPAADLPGVPRILLSHSPDQFAWAAAQGFQLMLAGHTHGGQVRLPLVGPLVAPSLHGVRYATHSVYTRPGCLMHVSRGISGVEPLRINCLPELARLTLVRG